MDDTNSPNGAVGAELVAAQAIASEGWMTEPRREDEHPPWARRVLDTYRGVDVKTTCPHLRDSDGLAVWFAAAPDLLACERCIPELTRRVQDQLSRTLAGGPRVCSVCGRPAALRGVSLGVSRIFLRAEICSVCEAAESDEEIDVADEFSDALRALALAPIRLDWPALEAATDPEAFNDPAYQLLGRAAQLITVLVDSVERALDARGTGLDVDAAVIGGLLVRTGKLTADIRRSMLDGESEAHSPLSRCLGETAITLRWLVKQDDPAQYKQYRSDSFVYWRKVLAHESFADDAGEGSHGQLAAREHIERELAVAGLTWGDIPKSNNSWGPGMRQCFDALDRGWMYDALFVSHSSYVHPSWHESRAFHLADDDSGIRLDSACANLAPISAFVLTRLALEAVRDAADVLPHDLEADALELVIATTVRGSKELAIEFAELADRGGLAAAMGRRRD